MIKFNHNNKNYTVELETFLEDDGRAWMMGILKGSDYEYEPAEHINVKISENGQIDIEVEGTDTNWNPSDWDDEEWKLKEAFIAAIDEYVESKMESIEGNYTKKDIMLYLCGNITREELENLH